MDWATIRDVLAKAREEISEIERPRPRRHRRPPEEIGNLMLAVANAPRFSGADAELTLRAACDKFVTRFERVASITASRGPDLRALAPVEIDALWNEAKAAPPATVWR